MGKENQEKINNNFFNKLFFQFNTIRNIKINIEHFKETKHAYYSQTSKLWFARGEDKNKYYYIFGSADEESASIEPTDYKLFIDFSKHEETCDDCIGILTENKLYFHKNNFIKKYPNFNLKKFEVKNLIILSQNNKRVEAIEIGSTNEFVYHLETIFKEIDSKTENANENNLDDETIAHMNLFLNAIESGKPLEQSLKIAKINQKQLDSWLDAAENKDKRYIDFYQRYYELIYTDKSKTANDNLMNAYYELKRKNKTIDFSDLLPKKTRIKMNVFINAYKEDKNLNYALKLSNLDKNLFYQWIEDGKNPSNEYYIFYKEYLSIKERPAVKVNSELASKNKELMEEFIRLKHEGKTNKEIYETLDIPRHLIKNWRNQGQMGNKKYKEFYEAYILDNSPKPKTKVTSSNELMEEFIRLKHEGKTNNEIYEILDIPRFLIKNWRNQGQMGNKKYKEFYEAYILDNSPKPKTKAKDKESIKITEPKIEKNKRKCKICGRKLHERHGSDLCNRCLKKRYAVKILGEILAVVEPEVSFRKDDLEILKISKIKIKDYIWTLKEFDLIIEDKSKIMLKDMDFLNNFAEECESEIEIQENISKKLSKTCKTCGETLEISNFFKTEDNEDGYEDNCKRCKKLISSAVFLKELIKYVDWESEFSLDEIKSNFQDPLLLQGNLWNLAENDLIILNHETNIYKLTDSQKGEEFIEKYYQKPKPMKKTPNMDPQKNEPPKKPDNNLKLTKNEQREIVLARMSRGRTRKEAAIIAKIPLYKITHWINEGRNGFGKENIDFYKKMKKIESEIKPYGFNELKTQFDNFLKSFNETKDKKLAAQNANVHLEDIDDWIILGEEGITPYGSFTKEFEKIKNNTNEDSDVEEFNVPINATKRKIFLEYIRTGSSIDKACEQASIDKEIITKWIEKGKRDIFPFNEFYNKYHSVGGKEIEIDDNDGYYDMKNIIKRRHILGSIKSGKTDEEACKIASLDTNLFNEWIKLGKENKEPYNEFYNEYVNAKSFKNNRFYEKEFLNTQNVSKRNIILKQIKLGKSYEEACKYVALDFDLFRKWIELGKENKEPFKEFYNEYKKITLMKHDIEEYIDIKNEDKRINFIVYLKRGISVDKSLEQSSLEKELFNKWVELGKEKVKPFDNFYNNYIDALDNNFTEEKRNEFLGYIKQGYSKSDAARKLDIDLNLVDEWLRKGTSGKDPYVKFLKSFKESKKISEDNREAKIKNDIIELIENGLSLEEASKEYENGSYEKEIIDWYEKGKNNDSNHTDFYEKANHNKPDFFDLIEVGYSVKIACEKTNLNYDEIKDKIETQDEEFFDKLVEAKILNKIEEYPTIKTTKDNEKITRLMNKIIKLAIKGKSSEEICEIVDLPFETYSNWIQRGMENFGDIYVDFYKNIYKINNLKQEIKDLLFKSLELPNILDKLPKEYDNFISTSDTGFAWVKKSDECWTYTRSTKEQIANYENKDIRELFKTVIENNQIWGVRDFNKALNSLKNPIINKNIIKTSEEETVEETTKISENEKEEKENNEKSILDPLPEDIEKELRKHSKGNRTGFAWVNKIGDQWIYARTINNNYVKFTDSNIYNLYNKVTENNYEWGVRDINTAKKSLENESKPDESNIQDKPDETDTIINQDILCPLPEKYESSFRSTKINKSGFAWVNKYGNFWTYAGNIDGRHVKINDENIYNLHQKVISQNLVWGVRDLNKAKKTLRNEKKPDIPIINDIDDDAKVTINYLSKTEFNTNILIKGTIPNDELFSVLSEFKIFEKYITRILSNKINDEMDILIELNLGIDLLSKFERIIKKLGWVIN